MSTSDDLAQARKLAADRRANAALSDLQMLTAMPSDQMREVVTERLNGLKLTGTELARARRAVAKQHHPDRHGIGGDPTRMAAANAVIDDLERNS
jgi:hypothetical protein